MAPINAITATARMEPTTIGSSGTPVPDFVRIGARRPALPLRAPAEAFARERVPELEAALKITEEVLRHLIVRKPEKVVPTPVPPPPAEVVQEPVAAGSVEAEGESRRPAREDREES